MRVIELGMNGTLIVLPKRELDYLNREYGRAGSICLLEGTDAPGVGIMVESDSDYDSRRVRDTTRPRIKRIRPKNRQNTAAKN